MKKTDACLRKAREKLYFLFHFITTEAAFNPFLYAMIKYNESGSTNIIRYKICIYHIDLPNIRKIEIVGAYLV